MATATQIQQVRLNIDDLPIEIDNFIDRGDCESVIAPLIRNETIPYLLNADWERSDEQKYKGNYSFKLTKTGSPVRIGFVDDAPNFLKMHGLEAGKKYTLSLMLYNPSITNNGFIFSNISLIFSYFYGITHELVENIVIAKELYDNWQELKITITLSEETTGIYIGLEAIGAGENFYVDEVKLYLDDPIYETYNENDFTDEIIESYIDSKDSVLYASYKLIDILIIRLRKEILKKDQTGSETSEFFDLRQRTEILENIRNKYKSEYENEQGNSSGKYVKTVKPIVAGGYV